MRTEGRINWFSSLRGLAARRYLFAIPLVLVLFTPFVCAQDNIIELTNGDVLAMVRDKVPADAIIKKIQTSRCHFDTFPTVISELRYKGVAEEILVAMVEAPIGRATKRVEDETVKTAPTGSVAPTQKSTQGLATKPTPASVDPTKKPTESLRVAGTGSAIVSRTESAKKGSGPAGSMKETVAPTVSVALREKTAAESVTAAPTGKASVKVTPTKQIVTGVAARTGQTPAGPISAVPTEKAAIGSVRPTPKQIDATKSVPLPLPELARPESGTAPNSAVPQPTGTSSTNSVTPVKTEKGASETVANPPADQPKQVPTPPQVLTNSDIIKLLRSGSTSTTVVATIKGAPGNYDLSARALLELQQAGADATVFLSMMETSQKNSDEKTVGSGSNGTTSLQNKKPE